MLSLKDRLSRLTYREACKLLGPEGGALIRQGGKYEIDIEAQVTWGDDFLKLDLGVAAVTFTLSPDRLKTLRFVTFCGERRHRRNRCVRTNPTVDSSGSQNPL